MSNKLEEKYTQASQTTTISFITIITRHSSHHTRKHEHNGAEHGEGDVGIWHHCLYQPHKNVSSNRRMDVWTANYRTKLPTTDKTSVHKVHK